MKSDGMMDCRAVRSEAGLEGRQRAHWSSRRFSSNLIFRDVAEDDVFKVSPELGEDGYRAEFVNKPGGGFLWDWQNLGHPPVLRCVGGDEAHLEQEGERGEYWVNGGSRGDEGGIGLKGFPKSDII